MYIIYVPNTCIIVTVARSLARTRSLASHDGSGTPCAKRTASIGISITISISISITISRTVSIGISEDLLLVLLVFPITSITISICRTVSIGISVTIRISIHATRRTGAASTTSPLIRSQPYVYVCVYIYIYIYIY